MVCMQSFRIEDAIVSRLNEVVTDSSPFTSIREAGPDIYKVLVTTDEPHYMSLSELFGDSNTRIQITPAVSVTVLQVGFDTEKIRYVNFRVVEE